MPSTENYITQASGDARYQALGALGSSTPAQVDAGDAGTAGVSSSAARQDHEHPVAITSAQLVPAALLAAWSTYVPIDENITVGNGTRSAAYVQIGKIVFFRWSLILGSTSAIGSSPSIGLPVAANAAAEQAVSCYILDFGTAHYEAIAVVGRANAGLDANKALLVCSLASGAHALSATTPFTFTTSDRITVVGMYEAA